MKKPVTRLAIAALCVGLGSQAEASQIPFESYGGLSYSQGADQVGTQLRKDGFGISQSLKNKADVYTATKSGIPVTVVCLYGPNSGLQDIITSFKTGSGASNSVFANEAITITREMGVVGQPSSNPSVDQYGNPSGIIQKTTWPQPYNSSSKVILTETNQGTVQVDFQGPGYSSLSGAPVNIGP